MQHYPELLDRELVLARKQFRRALIRWEGSPGKPVVTEQGLLSAALPYARAVRRFRREAMRGIA